MQGSSIPVFASNMVSYVAAEINLADRHEAEEQPLKQ